MGPPPTAARRKMTASIEGNDQNEHQQKRLKTSTMTISTQAQPSANAVEEALREDPVTRENVNFAQVSTYCK
jgi:hypothetical protein